MAHQPEDALADDAGAFSFFAEDDLQTVSGQPAREAQGGQSGQRAHVSRKMNGGKGRIVEEKRIGDPDDQKYEQEDDLPHVAQGVLANQIFSVGMSFTCHSSTPCVPLPAMRPGRTR